MPLNNEFNVAEITAYHHHLYKNDYVFNSRYHSAYTLHAILRGEMEVTCAEYVFRLGPEDFILLPGGDFHQSRVVGNDMAEMITVHFAAPDIQLGALPVAAKMSVPQRALLQLFCEDMERNGETQNGQCFTACTSAHKLFEVLLEYVSRFPTLRHEAPDENAVIYYTAVSFMKKQIPRQIRSEDVARVCRVSGSRLKGIFLQYTGVGYMEFGERLRLDYAKKMLDAGHSCGEVARTLEFCSQAYFSKRFKQFYGMPPTKYRGENR